MSLKAFHVFFIIVSDTLALGMAVWAWRQHQGIAWVAAAVLCSLGLNIYLVWFLKKCKDLQNT